MIRRNTLKNITLAALLTLLINQPNANAGDFCSTSDARATRYCTIAIITKSPLFSKICGLFLRRAIASCNDPAKVCNAWDAVEEMLEPVCQARNLTLCGQLTGIVFDCISKQLDGSLVCSGPVNPGDPTCEDGDQFGCIAPSL